MDVEDEKAEEIEAAEDAEVEERSCLVEDEEGGEGRKASEQEEKQKRNTCSVTTKITPLFK